MNLLNVEIRAGDPISINEHTITPFAQSMQVTIPGMNGGLIWNRPVSILVQTKDGEEQVLSVPDVTRQTIWTLFGATILITLFAWLISCIFKSFR